MRHCQDRLFGDVFTDYRKRAKLIDDFGGVVIDRHKVAAIG
jgi:hypothetical protein